jgi:flagellar hook protein FlgE
MGFQQALSGLEGAQQNLDIIGNNIANASTVGFKDVRAEFADVYARSVLGTVTNQVGIGVGVAAVQSQFTQGNITTTGNPLDIAINGAGFFREVQNGAVSYSRDGEFSMDANGFLVSPQGANLTGYGVTSSGTISAAPPTPIQLSLTPVAPLPTSTSSLSINLNSASTPPATTTFSPSVSSSYNWSTSQTIYDSQGNSHTASYYFANTGTNTWNVYATVDGSQVGPPNSSGGPTTTGAIGQLGFTSTGQLTSASPGATMNLVFPVTTGGGSQTVAVTFPSASTTQYGVASSISANTQNGYTTGQLSSFAISPSGIISGRYTNGQTVTLGQIALASFVNPQGLLPQGNNQFIESAASGAPSVGAPGSGSLGAVQSGALESSGVDITAELVNMITAQRVYQANAETVKTEDQMQQTLMNLR